MIYKWWVYSLSYFQWKHTSLFKEGHPDWCVYIYGALKYKNIINIGWYHRVWIREPQVPCLEPQH